MTENEQIVALTKSLLEMQKRYFALKDAFDSCAKVMSETREKNDALEKLNKSYFSKLRDAETQVDDLRSLINEKNKYIEELEKKVEYWQDKYERDLRD